MAREAHPRKAEGLEAFGDVEVAFLFVVCVGCFGGVFFVHCEFSSARRWFSCVWGTQEYTLLVNSDRAIGIIRRAGHISCSVVSLNFGCAVCPAL